MAYFCAVKLLVTAALLGLMSLCTGLEAQVKNQSITRVLPLLKTNQPLELVEQQLLVNGFIHSGGASGKLKNMEGMIDSIPFRLTLRKMSKKGNVWKYELLFSNASVDWVKKRKQIDQMANEINHANKLNPSVLLKTLPQYCHGNEINCFADGSAKYNYQWYWNNDTGRIKTMDLRVTTSFNVSILITDNVMEMKSQ